MRPCFASGSEPFVRFGGLRLGARLCDCSGDRHGYCCSLNERKREQVSWSFLLPVFASYIFGFDKVVQVFYFFLCFWKLKFFLMYMLYMWHEVLQVSMVFQVSFVLRSGTPWLPRDLALQKISEIRRLGKPCASVKPAFAEPRCSLNETLTSRRLLSTTIIFFAATASEP